MLLHNKRRSNDLIVSLSYNFVAKTSHLTHTIYFKIKMKYTLVVLASFLAVASAFNHAIELVGPKIEAAHHLAMKETPEGVDIANSIKADASQYVDQVLANLRAQMIANGLDNVELPDFTIGFEEKFLGIIWKGEAGLHTGSLRGLETIHRTGVADVSLDNGEIVISTEVGVNNAALNYSLIVQFMNIGPDATVDGELSKVKVHMVLRVGQNLAVRLDKFDIKSTGILTVDVKGLGAILNFLVEIVANAVGNVVKGFVAWFLEGTIKAIVNSILESIAFPPDVFVRVGQLMAFATGAF